MTVYIITLYAVHCTMYMYIVQVGTVLAESALNEEKCTSIRQQHNECYRGRHTKFERLEKLPCLWKMYKFKLKSLKL